VRTELDSSLHSWSWSPSKQNEAPDSVKYNIKTGEAFCWREDKKHTPDSLKPDTDKYLISLLSSLKPDKEKDSFEGVKKCFFSVLTFHAVQHLLDLLVAALAVDAHLQRQSLAI
jgi:hypothetical protein